MFLSQQIPTSWLRTDSVCKVKASAEALTRQPGASRGTSSAGRGLGPQLSTHDHTARSQQPGISTASQDDNTDREVLGRTE